MTLRAWPAKASLNADGSVNYDGRSCATPSTAAVAVREGRATNGWSMWGVYRGGVVVRLTALRAELENGHFAFSVSAGESESAVPVFVEEDVDPNAPDPADVQIAAVTFGSATEAAFAALAGLNLIPVSSGNTVRLRPNHGGAGD